ncbi:3, 4-dihydroxy-2-butanone 4-phosphate synthase [Hyaloraphidium curvatum]|nr:3, 4-dihydroxy-2-butanone 4-phosphate synthase [Hyaloraphidium curvatum]
MDEALAAFAKGDFLIVVDSIDRENEGDLIAAAQFMTPQKMAFMVRHTTGIICVPLLAERCAQLGLPLMVPPSGNKEYMGTAFTVTVDLKKGTTTGVSANDRTLTVKALADEAIRGEDFVMPGHIFPLMYRKGGVLKRTGHTEAGVDLCKLTNLYPAGVLSEIVLDNGEMARRDDLKKLAKEWGLKMISIEDMAKYRIKHGFTGEDW